MSSDMKLIGDNGYMNISILQYANSSAVDVYDANWLECHISLSMAGFEASYKCSITTQELLCLKQNIEEMVCVGAQKIEFVTMEEQIALTIMRNHMGQITAICMGQIFSPRARISIDLTFDETALRLFSETLNRSCLDYPIIELSN